MSANYPGIPDGSEDPNRVQGGLGPSGAHNPDEAGSNPAPATNPEPCCGEWPLCACDVEFEP